mgnify:CR=1 FL=1
MVLLVKLVLALGICYLMYGCASAPYRVCDNQNVCRNMSKTEALEAAEMHKEWQAASSLRLGVARP